MRLTEFKLAQLRNKPTLTEREMLDLHQHLMALTSWPPSEDAAKLEALKRLPMDKRRDDRDIRALNEIHPCWLCKFNESFPAPSAAPTIDLGASDGGKRSRRKRTKKSRTIGGKKSRKLRKRTTIKGGKRKRRRTRRRR